MMTLKTPNEQMLRYGEKPILSASERTCPCCSFPSTPGKKAWELRKNDRDFSPTEVYQHRVLNPSELKAQTAVAGGKARLEGSCTTCTLGEDWHRT